jgi:hypothetical protein
MATVAQVIRDLQASPHMGAEVRLGVSNLLTAVGDFTGGASEDMFTLAAHGLVDGDRVQLIYESAAGVVNGAVGDVFYVNQLSSSTFQLASNAAASTIVENTADGTAVFAVLGDLAVSTAGAGNVTFPADAPDVDAALSNPDEGFVTIG